MASQPETTGNERQQERQAQQAGAQEERSGGLPTIRQQDRRKAGADGAGTPGGGASDAEDNDDGTLLPPIGGIKGKRDGSKSLKAKTLKSTATAALQKAPAPQSTGGGSSHPLGSLSSSKGFGGTLPGAGGATATSQAAVSSGHPWVNGAGQEHARSGMGSRSSGGAPEKMHSTWSPSHQPRKYVSPFGHKLNRDAGGKKR